MEAFIILFFMLAWAIGIIASALIWQCGRNWPRARRLFLSSFTAALFLAPGLLVGHGVAPLPAILVLVIQPKIGVVTALLPVVITWVITLFVFLGIRYHSRE